MSSNPPPEDIFWWQSPTIRAVVVAMAPAIILGVKSVFHIDLTNAPIVDTIFALLAGISGVLIIIRRVKAGKDPASPAPQIKMRVL